MAKGLESPRLDPYVRTMVGKGRGTVLAVRSVDPVLSVVGPLGLAASVGTALVVDLSGDLQISHGRTLADIDVDGPSLEELSPGRSGVAVIGSGPIEAGRAAELIADLGSRWPALVVRVNGTAWDGPTVPLVPLYPGWLAASNDAASVWQPIGSSSKPSGPGPVLPILKAGLVRRLLNGQLPPRSRWIRAWSPVWDMPWA